ncbi:MAG TPA: hypothetical protein VF064_09760 [Pyrinomonadaceae bacterium]
MKAATACVLLLLFFEASFAQDAPAHAPAAPSADELVIDEDYTGDVFGVGRTVRVRGRVSHGVIAFGGDVVVEGRVEGDVATVGGSVSQREGSYVGGDVIILGGTYHHGKTGPGRNPSSNTIMFAGYEEELRGLARDPSVLLTPEFTLAFVGLRLLGVLLWFVVSLVLTAISPGAVSRGAARLQLTSLRVAVIGVLGALVAGPGVFAALHYLPPVLGVFVSATALLLLLFAYVFGRVCIYAATGRWLQRLVLAEDKRSESIALLLGAVFWSVLLTLPYVWPFVFAGLLVVSLGLSLTARHPLGRKRAAAAAA